MAEDFDLVRFKLIGLLFPSLNNDHSSSPAASPAPFSPLSDLDPSASTNTNTNPPQDLSNTNNGRSNNNHILDSSIPEDKWERITGSHIDNVEENVNEVSQSEEDKKRDSQENEQSCDNSLPEKDEKKSKSKSKSKFKSKSRTDTKTIQQNNIQPIEGSNRVEIIQSAQLPADVLNWFKECKPKVPKEEKKRLKSKKKDGKDKKKDDKDKKKRSLFSKMKSKSVDQGPDITMQEESNQISLNRMHIKIWYDDGLFKQVEISDISTAKETCQKGAVLLGMSSYTFGLFLIKGTEVCALEDNDKPWSYISDLIAAGSSFQFAFLNRPRAQNNDMRAKVFARWVNFIMMRKVPTSGRKWSISHQNLGNSISNGLLLIDLADVLFSKAPPAKRKVYSDPASDDEKLSNILLAFNLFRNASVDIAEQYAPELVKGSSQATQGVLWTIILMSFAYRLGFEMIEFVIVEEIKNWCLINTAEIPSIKIVDFAESFQDGVAFCGVMAHYLPSPLISKPPPKTRVEMLNHAFLTANRYANIPLLIDAGDMKESVDEMSIIIYLSLICQTFHSMLEFEPIWKIITPNPVRKTYQVPIVYKDYTRVVKNGRYTDVTKDIEGLIRLPPSISAAEVSKIISKASGLSEASFVVSITIEDGDEMIVSGDDVVMGAIDDPTNPTRSIIVRKKEKLTPHTKNYLAMPNTKNPVNLTNSDPKSNATICRTRSQSVETTNYIRSGNSSGTKGRAAGNTSNNGNNVTVKVDPEALKRLFKK